MVAGHESPSATLTDFQADCTSQTAEINGRTAVDPSPIRVLYISPNLGDQAALRGIVERIPCELSVAFNCQQAAAQITKEQTPVIFCDSVLEDGTWKRILNQIQERSRQPLLIVTSRLADEELWAEVLNLGGYDVLAKPFRPDEVRYTLTTAIFWLTRVAGPKQSAAAK